jgi:threonine aldolase
MVERLAEDHANARRLAVLLADAGLPLDMPPEAVETNMVFAGFPTFETGKAFVERLRAEGVVINPPRGTRIRFVTHYGIEASDIEDAGAAAARAWKAVGRPAA